ncbi:MAG: immunoglobulin domain-containing protein, partial [Verrucomicrobiia bacterium]
MNAFSLLSGLSAAVCLWSTVGLTSTLPETQAEENASGWAGGHPEAVFGLGSASSADVVRVEWPSGMATEASNLPANRLVTLAEPEAALVAEPNGGSYFESVVVALRTTIPGGEIRYTLNAGHPQSDSTLYAGGIKLTESAVLRAIVFTNGVAASPVLVRSYSILPRSIVVPVGFADKEDDGQSGVLGYTPMRLQNVYGDQSFPQHPILIREIRFRRDADYGTPVTEGRIRARFTMSATAKSPDQLSRVMDENTGSDAAVVFDGELTMTSSGPTVPGGPNPFDLVVPLQVPYVYNPYDGNLLLDIQVFETSGLSHTDASNDLDDNASRVFAYEPNASLASFSDTGADIIQLIYSDALPSIWFAPRPGPYDRSISLSISSGVSGGVIRFTLDGSEPTVDSAAYEQPIRLSNTTTVKARVFVDGAPASDVVTGLYEITLTPPAIVSEPQTQTVVEGGNVTFTASVTGSPPLAYQWAFNGVPVPGQTNSTLSIANVGFDNAGTYSLTVSNEVGTVSKDLLTLTVTPKPIPPTIVVQPKSIMVVTGSVATFTVVATGTEPLAYQWKRSTTTVGTNSPTLTITNVKNSDAGTYRVRVLNSAGSVYSDYATLQVFDAHVAPQITSSSTGARVNIGERVVFSAECTGTLPLGCQWYKNGVPVEGATDPALVIETAQPADEGTYVLVVSNPAGSAATTGAVLYVWPAEVGGTVNFNNIAAPSGVDAPIYDSDGVTKLSGAAFLAQLYAGKAADQLVPVGPAVPFETGVAVGYVCQRFTSRVIPFVAPGEPVFVQMRVWETAFGATYETAVLAGGKTGASDVLNVVTGGAGSPPSLPADLAGLKSFSVKREAVPPTVVIESPVAGTTADERVTLVGVVTDNTRVESARWELNGQPMGALALDPAGRFNQAGVRLRRGENVVRVVGRDAAGNEAAAKVIVVWQPLREIALVGPESEQEGRLIAFDLLLRSPGDVAGLSFAMSFGTDQFRDASFAWSDAVSAGSGQVNLDVPGTIQATLSLPGTTIAAGTVRLGTLSLRARSVPASQAQTVSLNLL